MGNLCTFKKKFLKCNFCSQKTEKILHYKISTGCHEKNNHRIRMHTQVFFFFKSIRGWKIKQRKPSRIQKNKKIKASEK